MATPNDSLQRVLCLLAWLTLLMGAYATPKRPEILLCEAHLRRLNVVGALPTAPLRTSVSRFEFAVIDAVFDQPLYLSGGSSGGARRLNYTSLSSSDWQSRDGSDREGDERGLEGALVLKCPHSGRRFSLSMDWPADYWEERQEVGGGTGSRGKAKAEVDEGEEEGERLLLTHSSRNPLHAEFALFHAYRRDDALRSTARDANVLSLLLKLSPSTSSSSSSPQSVIATGRSINRTELLSCSLSYLPAEQRATETTGMSPVVALTNRAGVEVNMTRVPLQPTASSSSPSPSSSTADGLVTVERSVFRLRQGSAEERYAWAEQWNGTAASGRNSSVAAWRTRRARLGRDLVLLQEKMQARVGFVSMLVSPIAKGIMKPIVTQTTSLMMTAVGGTLNNELFHGLINQVAPDLTVMLGTTLRANLSNVLVDSLSYGLTRALSVALTRSVGPHLVGQVAPFLTPRLHKILNKVLQEKLPESISGGVATAVNRVVGLTLTGGLSRSLPFALVPALTHTLGHHRHTSTYCALCFYARKHCNLCAVSEESVYYQLYYATYYTEWYTEYYADYYTQSVQKVDAAMHTSLNGDELIEAAAAASPGTGKGKP